MVELYSPRGYGRAKECVVLKRKETQNLGNICSKLAVLRDLKARF